MTTVLEILPRTRTRLALSFVAFAVLPNAFPAGITDHPWPPFSVTHTRQQPIILAQVQPQEAPTSGAPRTSANSATNPEFEVATVKPLDTSRGFAPGIKGGPGTADPDRITYTNSLKRLLMTAYSVGNDFISGPAWLDTGVYVITATIRPGATKEQVSQMLQNLLNRRFQMTLHRETRDVPLYELTLVGKGPQLKEYVADSHAANGRGFAEGLDFPSQYVSDGISHAVANKVSIAQLINFLSFQLKRPVVDKTRMTGFYNYNLDFVPVLPGPAENISTASAPDLITAVREQLGMKLNAKKGPLEIIVIDHAEKTPIETE